MKLAVLAGLWFVLAGCAGATRRDPVEGLVFARVEGFASGKPLWVGKNLVPVRAYLGCVNHGGCSSAPLERKDPQDGRERCNGRAPAGGVLPLNCVGFDEAQKLCAWVRGRLPTEAEWQVAARSGAGLTGQDGKLAEWIDGGSPGARQVRGVDRPAPVPDSGDSGIGFRCVQE